MLFSSGELLEYRYLCHRGRLRVTLTGPEVTEHRLLHAVNTGAAA